MSRINYPARWTADDIAALDDLFAKARSQRRWFYHNSIAGEWWFTPDELQAEQERGSYIWGAANWRLRDPLEQVTEIERQLKALNEKRAAILKKLGVEAYTQ